MYNVNFCVGKKYLADFALTVKLSKKELVKT